MDPAANEKKRTASDAEVQAFKNLEERTQRAA
jgi:hypothetical protein